MEKFISPRAHALLDYALVGSLLVMPTVLKLPKSVRKLYASDALILLGYIATTQTPVAVKPVIPFKLHGKIDPFNLAGFAMHFFVKGIKKSRKATIFNSVFLAVAAATVIFTDWDGRTEKQS